MLNIKTVTVIGADGTMGALTSGLIAAFGNARVYMLCYDREIMGRAADAAVNSIKAGSIRSRLIPRTYDDFETCVAESEWVFESVTENAVIKAAVNRRIQACKKPGLIVTTGTSGLSVSELAKNFDEDGQKRYFGTHFFNPPYNMTLCEMIRNPNTDAALFEDMRQYLETTLLRDVIETADTAAFLGNRIGFHFMNKALQYAVKHQQDGGIDYIDAILGPFTGRDMTPIATADFVGLDVHKAIVDHLKEQSCDYDNQAFALPEFVNERIRQGKLGRKTREGLFKQIVNDDKSKQRLVYDIAAGELRPVKKYDLPFARAMVSAMKFGDYARAMDILKTDASPEGRLCKFFLVAYIAYGIATAQAISPRIIDADIAMSAGFNWVGPVALMEALGGYRAVRKLAESVDEEDGKLIQALDGAAEAVAKGIAPPFGYRKYFRARV